MCVNPRIEKIGQDDLQNLQLERLQKTVSWAYSKSAFYRKKLAQAGIEENSIRRLDDIENLPFTTKQEYMANSPYDYLTFPLSSIVRASLWEHPEPVIKMYTDNDIARNLEVMTRLISAAGINRTSVVGIIGDLADSGLMDMQYAVEFMGATVVMLSADYERALRLMDIVGIDTLIGSSRRLLQLIVVAQANNKDITEYPVRTTLCLTDTIQNPLRGHIAQRTNTEVVNLFSSSVFGSCGIMCECEEHFGAHLQADMFYPELLAFGTNEVIDVPDQVGELVVTTLTNEAMPLIRYRTGQAVKLVAEPCACGRTLPLYATPYAEKHR